MITMMSNKFFPVPDPKKKKKRSFEDEILMRPIQRSYEKYVNLNDILPESVPANFLTSSTPTPFSGLPAQYRNSTQTQVNNVVLQQQRSETTERALIGQQETLQHQLDIIQLGSLDMMKKFVAMSSDRIDSNLMENRFGTPRPSVRRITERLRRVGAPEDKRSLLAELISRSDLALDYYQHVNRQRETTEERGQRIQTERNLPSIIVTDRITGETRNLTQPESSRMAEARARTNRQTGPRQHVRIDNAEDDIRDYMRARDVLNLPSASTNPLFQQPDTETE